jgi:hypothetical protein
MSSAEGVSENENDNPRTVPQPLDTQPSARWQWSANLLASIHRAVLTQHHEEEILTQLCSATRSIVNLEEALMKMRESRSRTAALRITPGPQ